MSLIQKTNPLITVVVPTYNGAEYIADCIESLINQKKVDSLSYEILVIDNNSTDNTIDIVNHYCSKYKNIKLIREINQGLSHVRNRGYLESKSEYIAYIDDDCTASANWVANIINSIKSVEPKPVVIGGKILPRFKSQQPAWFSEELETFTWGSSKRFLTDKEREGFYGANIVIQRKVLVQYGGFNISFGMKGEGIGLGEEIDLFNRIYEEHPFFWYDPDIYVNHLIKDEFFKINYRLRRAWETGRLTFRLYGHKKLSLLFYCTSRIVWHSIYIAIHIITFQPRYRLIKRVQLIVSKISCLLWLFKSVNKSSVRKI